MKNLWRYNVGRQSIEPLIETFGDDVTEVTDRRKVTQYLASELHKLFPDMVERIGILL